MIINISKITCKTITAKIELTSNSKSHTYFIEQLVYMTEKPKNTMRKKKLNTLI
jgi:hypothetical protein